MVRGLIDRLIVRPAGGGGFEIELVGDIARMVELGAGAERRKAALDEKAACSVKVVAGTRNQRCLPRLVCRVRGSSALMYQQHQGELGR